MRKHIKFIDPLEKPSRSTLRYPVVSSNRRRVATLARERNHEKRAKCTNFSRCALTADEGVRAPSKDNPQISQLTQRMSDGNTKASVYKLFLYAFFVDEVFV